MKLRRYHKQKRTGWFWTGTAIITAALILQVIASAYLPGSFSVIEGESFSFPAGSALCIRQPVPSSAVQEVQGLHNGSQQAEISLFGILPLKKVTLISTQRQTVLLGGELFGMRMFTDGVIVVGFHDVTTQGGACNPGAQAGLRVGDIIREVNGEVITSNAQFSQWVEASGGNTLILTILRGEEELVRNLSPMFDTTVKGYRAGLWARDSTAGIGTMTFTIPESNLFAGLGHGICDADSHVLMPLSDGETLAVSLAGINKGTVGRAGELKGFFADEIQQGQLLCNTHTGVYGIWSVSPRGEPIEVALKQEIKRGAAQIYVAADGKEPQWYDISIERVNYNADTLDKNMVIHVTDPDLIALTGGIVQGMSGSPIVQNGRLVGAVTHVFVNDPTKGYGIFIENMQETAKNVTETYTKGAA